LPVAQLQVTVIVLLTLNDMAGEWECCRRMGNGAGSIL